MYPEFYQQQQNEVQLVEGDVDEEEDQEDTEVKEHEQAIEK